MHFLGISGSLRRHSTNSALLRALADVAPAGMGLDIYARLGELPIFNPDDEGERTPSAVVQLIDAVREARGVVMACPEYAHGVPGGMKNALDWLVSRDVAVDKPVMLVHASPRSITSRAALQEILRTMNFRLLPEPELKVRLIGLPLDAWPMVFAAPETRAAMDAAWLRFIAFTAG